MESPQLGAVDKKGPVAPAVWLSPGGMEAWPQGPPATGPQLRPWGLDGPFLWAALSSCSFLPTRIPMSLSPSFSSLPEPPW